MSKFHKTIIQNNVNFILAIIIFLCVFSIHFTSKTEISFDSMWSIYTSMSIIKEGNINLNEYEEILAKRDYYGIEVIDDNLYNKFPIGTSLISLPFIFLIEKYWNFIYNSDFNDYIQSEPVLIEPIYYMPAGMIEKFISSIFIGLSSMLIFYLFMIFVNKMESLLIVFIYACCTSVWSSASRGLSSHSPSLLLIILSFYLLIKSEKNPKLIKIIGFPLLFSYIIRPSNIISIIAFSIYIFIKHRKYFNIYIIFSSVIIAIFFIFNIITFKTIFPIYYSPDRAFSNSEIFNALFANLISPGRGVFIFSPILLFAIHGIYIRYKSKQWSLLDYIIIFIIIFHLLLISGFHRWWAGHSYGARFFTDVILYFCYFISFSLSNILNINGFKKYLYLSLFTILCLISFFIHLNGATNPDVYRWNNYPDVDINQSQIWNINNLQFLYKSEKFKEKKYNELLKKANIKLSEKDYSSVMKYSKKAIALYPEEYLPYIIYALASEKMNLKEDAKNAWINAVCKVRKKATKKDFITIRNGIFNYGMSFTDVLKIGNAELWQFYTIAKILEHHSFYEDACDVWDYALKNSDNENIEFYFGLYRCYYQLGKFHQALSIAEKCLEINPGHGWVLLYIGDAYKALNQKEKALSYYQKCLESNIDAGSHNEANLRIEKLF